MALLFATTTTEIHIDIDIDINIKTQQTATASFNVRFSFHDSSLFLGLVVCAVAIFATALHYTRERLAGKNIGASAKIEATGAHDRCRGDRHRAQS